MFLPRGAVTYNPVEYTDREIQEHLEYLRRNHFLRDDFLERRLNASNRRRRRRRRRGRFAKMKKLSPAEVENLFPKCRYEEWLDTGDDDGSSVSEQASKDSSLIMSSGEVKTVAPILLPKTDAEAGFGVVEITESSTLQQPHTHNTDLVSLGALLRVKPELHFDSGSCAICLEVYEPDDIVRGLICGHVYHADCVDPWLTRRRACCPICKRDYYKEEGGPGSENGPVNIEEETAAHERGDSDPHDANPEEHEQQHTDAQRHIQEIPGTVNDTVENSTEISPRENNDTTDTNTNANNNTENGREAEPANPLQDINYDVIRADSNIQALFNELVPLSERVRVLLEEYPELDMDARAQEVAKKKYGNIFKILFWKLMGISKKDLYHWAVIKIYQQEQASLGTSLENRPESRNEQGTDVNENRGLETDNGVAINTGAPNVGESLEMTEIRRYDLMPTSRTASVADATEEDLADAARRREAVEERV